jgi:16S rRNA (guanine(966)-N(2))-methyltransferase RsmD
VADRPGLRPTPDRVRETLFNWLGQDLTGWRCLDAFAGSGALGFEAASRGASEVLLVEQDAGLVAALRQVKDRLGAQAVNVLSADGLSVLSRAASGAYDLVFLDPPYASHLLDPALAAAARVVRPGGFVYAEAHRALLPPPGWLMHRQGRAGAVWHHLFRQCGDGQHG